MLIKDTNSGKLLKDSVTATHLFTEPTPVQMFSTKTNSKTVVLSGSVTGNSTVQDSYYDNYTSANIATLADVQFRVVFDGWTHIGTPVFWSSNESVVTVNQTGTTTFIGVGTSQIFVYIPGLGTQSRTVTVTMQGGQTVSTFNNFVSSSLCVYLVNDIDSNIASLTPPSFAGSPPYAYSSLINLFQPSGSRNYGGWWGEQDMTCIPKSIGTNGVLVCPDIMIFAAHFGASSPTFQDNSGNQYSRSIVNSTLLTSPVSDGSDILVALLNSPLPSAITPAKVLPANYALYAPNPQNAIPAFGTNQDRTLVLFDVTQWASIYDDVVANQSMATSRSSWGYTIRAFDSGSPIFLKINGSLVVLGTVHGPGAYPSIADNQTQINTAITALGSSSHLSVVDLSSFTEY